MYVKAFIVNVNKCPKTFFLVQHINIVNRVKLKSFWLICSCLSYTQRKDSSNNHLHSLSSKLIIVRFRPPKESSRTIRKLNKYLNPHENSCSKVISILTTGNILHESSSAPRQHKSVQYKWFTLYLYRDVSHTDMLQPHFISCRVVSGAGGNMRGSRNFCQSFVVPSLFYSLQRGSNGFIAEKTMLSFFFSFFNYWHDQIMIITPGSAILKKKQQQNKKTKTKQANKNLSAVFLTK